MNHPISRRSWLRETSLVLAGLGLTAHRLFASTHNPPPSSAILLGSNENPYGPPPLAQDLLINSYRQCNRYPDNAIGRLKEKISAYWGVSEKNILLGAGSSEIIGLAAALASRSPGHILTTEPSYRVWSGQATAFGLQFKRNPLHQIADQPVKDLFGPIGKDTRMVYICNPNNPTGTVLNTDEIAQLIPEMAKSTIVFIDEAYSEYAQSKTMAPLAISNPNIIVAKTFSKIYGMAGARIGYAIAHPYTISALSRFQPWRDASINTMAATAAMGAIDGATFIESCRIKNQQAKELCYETFQQLQLKYLPSQTNFILFNIDPVAKRFAETMRKHNIEVQFREHYAGKWCRVSMGNMEEMKLFNKALIESKN